MRLPRFYDWGGCEISRTWSFGWLTGKDNDLVCVRPDIHTPIAGEVALSPICSNLLLAFFAFVIKAILVRIDCNLRDLESQPMTGLPTKNFAIGKRITPNTTYVVSLPFASPLPTSVCPHQILIAPNIRMVMSSPSTLASSTCSSPCQSNNIYRKTSHFTSPFYKLVLTTKPNNYNIKVTSWGLWDSNPCRPF